jgi:hypothetical protein
MSDPISASMGEAVNFGIAQERARIIGLLRETLTADFGSDEVDYSFYTDLCERLISIIEMPDVKR